MKQINTQTTAQKSFISLLAKETALNIVSIGSKSVALDVASKTVLTKAYKNALTYIVENIYSNPKALDKSIQECLNIVDFEIKAKNGDLIKTETVIHLIPAKVKDLLKAIINDASTKAWLEYLTVNEELTAQMTAKQRENTRYILRQEKIKALGKTEVFQQIDDTMLDVLVNQLATVFTTSEGKINLTTDKITQTARRIHNQNLKEQKIAQENAEREKVETELKNAKDEVARLKAQLKKQNTNK